MPVVDASVVVAVLAPDADQTEEVDVNRLWRGWVERAERLWAPELLRLEVMNALLTGIRRQRWDGEAADQANAFLATLPVVVEDVDADRVRAWELARRFDNWPIYDMVYSAMAERLGEPLVTLDDRLIRRFATYPGWVIGPAQN
jgi:predicted nucleic acid-binding protein